MTDIAGWRAVFEDDDEEDEGEEEGDDTVE